MVYHHFQNSPRIPLLLLFWYYSTFNFVVFYPLIFLNFLFGSLSLSRRQRNSLRISIRIPTGIQITKAARFAQCFLSRMVWWEEFHVYFDYFQEWLEVPIRASLCHKWCKKPLLRSTKRAPRPLQLLRVLWWWEPCLWTPNLRVIDLSCFWSGTI